MATDYISREAAVAAMTALRQEDIEAFGMVIPECFPSASAIGALNRIPAADVRPVVMAHWIETAPINEKTMKPFIVKGPHLKCSNCGSIEFQRNYCPNCGADMREANK